jgi:hypothetical protein
MEPLVWELLNGIFFGFGVREEPFSRDNFMTEMLKLQPYFELYHEAKDTLEDVSLTFMLLLQDDKHFFFTR